MAKKILICDDDPLLRELVQLRLSEHGFETMIARDGRDALAQMRVEKPDGVILDSAMPVMDGNQVLRAMRNEDSTRAIPVLMLTGRRDERAIVGSLELGADDYVLKPFVPQELLGRLVALVGQP